MTKEDEPFNFVWVSEDATDEGPILFDTYHAESYKWEDKHSYSPKTFEWFIDGFGWGPKEDHLMLMRFE